MCRPIHTRVKFGRVLEVGDLASYRRGGPCSVAGHRYRLEGRPSPPTKRLRPDMITGTAAIASNRLGTGQA